MLMDEKAKDIVIGMLAMLVFILFLLLVSCAPKKVLAKSVTDRNSFTYIEGPKDKFVVWVKSGDESKVKEEICTPSYVCAVAPAGKVLTIERTRK